MGGKLAAGCGRHLYHLPTLKSEASCCCTLAPSHSLLALRATARRLLRSRRPRRVNLAGAVNLRAEVLATPNVFRPKLQLVHGGRAHVAVRASDLTAQPAMRCLGMVVPAATWHGALLGQDQLDALVALLQAQDNSPGAQMLCGCLSVRVMCCAGRGRARVDRASRRRCC